MAEEKVIKIKKIEGIRPVKYTVLCPYGVITEGIKNSRFTGIDELDAGIWFRNGFSYAILRITPIPGIPRIIILVPSSTERTITTGFIKTKILGAKPLIR